MYPLPLSVFKGVCGAASGSERELFKTTAASLPFASSPHMKKSHLVG